MGSPEGAIAFLQYLVTQGDAEGPALFDSLTQQGIHSVEAERGMLTCLFPVEKTVQNTMGNLHGGCIGG
jgi:hypothetical protein